MAAKLIRFSLKDRTTAMSCNSNEFDSGENRELPELVQSVFPRESWMLPINTTSITTGSGGNSRLGGVSMTGAATSGATGALDQVGTISQMNFEIPAMQVSAGVQQVFVVNEASDLATRKFDIVPSAAGKLQLFDQASSVTPVATCSNAHPIGTPTILQIAANMGTNGTDGTLALTVLNAITGATIDSCSASSLNLGDFGGGSTFGDSYRGMFASRGAGACNWSFGANAAVTTGGFLPWGWTTTWLRPTVLSSALNSWSIVNASTAPEAVRFWDSKTGSLGGHITRASGAGTGSGSKISFTTFASVDGKNLAAATAIYGVTVLMDGWSTAGTPRYVLTWTYKGVDYTWTAGGTAQMNPPVAGDGGYPHTRCLVYFDLSGSTYLGPDGLAWDAASIAASTVSVQLTVDTSDSFIGGIMIGVCGQIPVGGGNAFKRGSRLIRIYNTDNNTNFGGSVGVMR